MIQNKLSRVFFISLSAFFIIPFFFPFCRFFFFAPFLIFCLYKKNLWITLWTAIGIGIIEDLLTTTHFGLASCNDVLTCLFLFRLKRHFFEDNFSTLFIMTTLFSFFSMIIKILFSKILGYGFAITLGFIITDLLIMPLWEGLFAFCLFTLPYYLFKTAKRWIIHRRSS